MRRTEGAAPRRVAMLSVHTSPLDQPGTGDSGGMNVYITELASRLAGRGVLVDVFTRATASSQPAVVPLAPGVDVRHVVAGPYEGLGKADLPGQLCALTAGVLRAEAARPEGWYDLVHSHYWLSGQVGWLAADRWNVPLVHTMHTMALVKNAALAAGDTPEPAGRVIGEHQVVAAADRLIANTDDEARALIERYDADPALVSTVHPGVDLDTFTPGDRAAARAAVGVRDDELVLLFVGRIQPLKAPDLLVRVAAAMVSAAPELRDRLRLLVVGGPSGSGLDHPHALEELAAAGDVADLVTFVPPVDRARLVDYYRSADIVAVPSYSESFGLVAIEAQACGTPVVAARVGGLSTAVADHVSGVLVDSHDPIVWAAVLSDVLRQPRLREALAEAARRHALGFGWDATVDGHLEAYRLAARHRAAVLPPSAAAV